METKKYFTIKIGESSKSLPTVENVKEENELGNDVPETGVDEGIQEQPKKPAVMYKINMDKIMSIIGVPFRKFKESLYLVAATTKEEIEKIVAQIQSLTKVTWSVKQTRRFDKDRNIITRFKRTYGCHMATRCRTATKKVRHKRSRNINCPAQLIVTVRRYNPRSRSKIGTLLDAKYPCAMEFRNHHNHPLDAEHVLNTRPLGEEVKQDVLDLLNKGHSCASAYHTLYTLKVEEFGADYKTKMKDRHYFPKKNDISTLFKSHNFKERSEQNVDFSYTIKNLKEILSSYRQKNSTMYRIGVIKNVVVVCICTPLMQRTIQQISEIMFIESSPDEIKEYKMYFILTQASVGALPIACILTNSHGMVAFNEGMRLFFQMIQVQPTVVLTTPDIMKELHNSKFFPNSKIMHSFYHILGAAWKLLHDSRHDIMRSKKESFYQLFREVVFADSEEGLVVARQVLAVECAHQKFLDFVDKMYENIALWCLFYRQFIVLRGVDTFNYNEAETSFRLFRLISKIPLDRTKLLNLTQITDFMCSAFEKYYKKRIVEIVLNIKESKVLQEKYARTPDNIFHMEDIGHEQYLFKKAAQEIPDEYYQLDMITNWCTCALGVMGKLCGHISEVLARNHILTPPLTIEQKAAYYFVATGVLKHKNSFLPEGERQEFRVCSPEIILGSGAPIAESLDQYNNSLKTDPSLENTIDKWVSYSNKMVKFLEKDPERFLPAINAHLENIQKYATTVPMLLKGLYAGFPYKGDAEKLPPLTIISNKVTSCGQSSEPPPLVFTSQNRCTNPPPKNSALSPVKLKQATKNKTKNGEPCSVPQKKRRGSVGNISVRFRRKKEPSNVNFVVCNTPVNYTNETNLLKLVDAVEHSDGTSTSNILILDGTDGSLVEKQNEASQMSKNEDDPTNDNNHFEGDCIEFDIPPEDSEVFDIQKRIYVNQNALNQLTDCEMVLDEKEGILIIPVPPE